MAPPQQAASINVVLNSWRALHSFSRLGVAKCEQQGGGDGNQGSRECWSAGGKQMVSIQSRQVEQRRCCWLPVCTVDGMGITSSGCGSKGSLYHRRRRFLLIHLATAATAVEGAGVPACKWTWDPR